MKPKFQADADLNENILKGVLRREAAVDFKTASAGGLRGMTELAVLEFAAQENRLVVSHDRKTMPRSFAEFCTSASSPDY